MKTILIAGAVLALSTSAALAQTQGIGSTGMGGQGSPTSPVGANTASSNPSQASTTGPSSSLGPNSGTGIPNAAGSPSAASGPNSINSATGFGSTRGVGGLPGSVSSGASPSAPGSSAPSPGGIGPH